MEEHPVWLARVAVRSLCASLYGVSRYAVWANLGMNDRPGDHSNCVKQNMDYLRVSMRHGMSQKRPPPQWFVKGQHDIVVCAVGTNRSLRPKIRPTCRRT